MLFAGANAQELAFPRVTTIFDGHSTDMWGLVYDPGKNVLFYSRTNSEDIREYNLASGAESLVTDGSALLGLLQGFDRPSFMASAGSGQNIIFSEFSKLRAISPSGSLESSSTFEGGANLPRAIVSLPDGSVYVADSGDDVIMKWQNGGWETFAGPLTLKPFSLAYNTNDGIIYFAV
uniref:SMP-30/Gluconolactonase/LRE-like region domain-containing protein n=1 Tax=Dunaliella tertiolecta TaxID=3047 RepID=A0A7S3R4K4_DUNTE|mmetsp:Transcript_1683/g.3715  ORF Transcript_1683/g.3715 Transcript_1683/m.3715 type:complete len:177 (-) Transcript_1683:209-739(-)